MEIVRWAGAIVLWGAALWVIAINWLCMALILKARITGRKTRNYSWIPFVGTVLTAGGVLVSPLSFSVWWLVVCVLDPGTIGTIVSFPRLLRGLRT